MGTKFEFTISKTLDDEERTALAKEITKEFKQRGYPVRMFAVAEV